MFVRERVHITGHTFCVSMVKSGCEKQTNDHIWWPIWPTNELWLLHQQTADMLILLAALLTVVLLIWRHFMQNIFHSTCPWLAQMTYSKYISLANARSIMPLVVLSMWTWFWQNWLVCLVMCVWFCQRMWRNHRCTFCCEWESPVGNVEKNVEQPDSALQCCNLPLTFHRQPLCLGAASEFSC